VSEQYDAPRLAHTIYRLRQQVAALKTERDALLEALEEAMEYDGGANEMLRVCCGVSVWKAHEADCWVPKARAAIDAAREVKP
jgi:hypothetical protein